MNVPVREIPRPKNQYPLPKGDVTEYTQGGYNRLTTNVDPWGNPEFYFRKDGTVVQNPDFEVKEGPRRPTAWKRTTPGPAVHQPAQPPEPHPLPAPTTVDSNVGQNSQSDTMPKPKPQPGGAPSGPSKSLENPKPQKSGAPKGGRGSGGRPRGRRRYRAAGPPRRRTGGGLSLNERHFLLCHANPHRHEGAPVRPHIGAEGASPVEMTFVKQVNNTGAAITVYYIISPSPTTCLYSFSAAADPVVDTAYAWDGSGGTGAGPFPMPAEVQELEAFSFNALGVMVEVIGPAATTYLQVHVMQFDIPGGNNTTIVNNTALSTLGLTPTNSIQKINQFGGRSIVLVPGYPATSTAKFGTFSDEHIPFETTANNTADLRDAQPYDHRLCGILLQIDCPAATTYRLVAKGCMEYTTLPTSTSYFPPKAHVQAPKPSPGFYEAINRIDLGRLAIETYTEAEETWRILSRWLGSMVPDYGTMAAAGITAGMRAIAM